MLACLLFCLVGVLLILLCQSAGVQAPSGGDISSGMEWRLCVQLDGGGYVCPRHDDAVACV
jgi:hypothetical protein